MDPKNAIILSFQSYYIVVPLSQHLLSYSTQVTQKTCMEKKGARDHMVHVELELFERDQETHTYPNSVSEESQK